MIGFSLRRYPVERVDEREGEVDGEKGRAV